MGVRALEPAAPVQLPLPIQGLVPGGGVAGGRSRGTDASSDPDRQGAWLLAHQVARGGRALRITTDNRGAGWVTLAAALHEGGAFAVEVRADIVVLDDDGCRRHVHGRGACGCGALDALVDALEAIGAPVVRCASGGGGDRSHLFLSGVPGPIRDRLDHWARSYGIDARRVVRPPLAPHRGGGRSHLVGVSLDQALHRLAPGIGGSVPWDSLVLPGSADAAVRPAASAVTLSPRMQALMTHGARSGGYPSESEARMALTLFVRTHGGGEADLTELFNRPDCAIGRRWRRESPEWRAQELARLLQRTHDRLGAGGLVSRAAAVAAVAAWLTRLDAQEWGGVRGLSARAAAESLAALGHRRGGVRFAASVDEVALGAGMHRATAKRALDRLIDAGLLGRAAPPTATQATVWILRTSSSAPPATTPSAATPSTAAPPSADAPVVPGSDAPVPALGSSVDATTWPAQRLVLGDDWARWQGVGKAAAVVWRELGAEPQTRRALAARTGMRPVEVGRQLARLRTHHLASQSRGGWVLGPTSPGDVAVRLGVDGAGAAQAQSLVDGRAQRRAARTAWVAARRAVEHTPAGTHTGPLPT